MRIVALDLLRFFAALLVVVYHHFSRNGHVVFPELDMVTRYGYLGVPLFFIISGYVIALSAQNRSPVEFAISRFVRIYPAFVAGVAFTAIIVFIFTYNGKTFSAEQILSNLTIHGPYFGHKDLDDVYWTLREEIKFYACVFLLMMFGVFDRYKVWLSIWMGITLLHLVTNQPFFMGWFISPGYSSFFIAGIALYLIQTNGINLFNCLVLFVSLGVSSVVTYQQAPGFMNNPSDTERLVAVAWVWLFYLLMYLLSRGKLGLKHSRLYTTLGALTYPLYLVHNVAGKAIVDYFAPRFGEAIMQPVAVAFVILVACLMHYLVEKPISTPLKRFLLDGWARLTAAGNLPLPERARVETERER